MKLHNKRPITQRLLLITAFAGLLFFAGLGAQGLHDPDETRYAEIAREMLESGNFIVPHLNYVPYLDKPPLLYWATSLALKVFGLNEFAARVVPALSGLLCVIAVYLFGCAMVGERAAFRAAIVLSTSAFFFALSRTLLTDMMLTLFVTLAIGFLYLSWERGRRWLVPAYIAMALGALTKGPEAVLLPAIPAGILVIKTKGIRGLTSLLSGWAILAFLAVWLPWHVAIYYVRPEFYTHFFLTENLGGFFQKGIHHAHPSYYTIGYLALGFVPWTLFLPAALWGVFSRRDSRRDVVLLCLAWAGAIVLIFSLSVSKLPTYILPALPPLALLVGMAVPDERVPPLPVRITTCLIGAAFCVSLVLVAVFVAPEVLRMTSEIRKLCVLTLCILVVLGVLLARSAGRTAFVLGACVIPATLTLVLLTHSPEFLEFRSPRTLASSVLARKDVTDVACFGQQHPNLSFYVRRRQIIVDCVPRIYRLGLSLQPQNDSFISSRKFMQKVKTHSGIYCVVRDKELKTFEERFGSHFRLVTVVPYGHLEYLFVNTAPADGEPANAKPLPDWELRDFLNAYGFHTKTPEPKKAAGLE
ncbi:MAG: glycosyltransferase family 39 protein [Planctomycetes bacterium]|nr:glycosyltransferase family 39 protein [Planctomycetota bacterium]